MQGEIERRDRLPEYLEAILEHNGEKWLKFVLGVVGNREDAEDALQEGLRRVLGCNRAFITEDEARMYLARSISNTAFEIYKCRKRERAHQIPIPSDLLVDGRVCDPQSLMEEREKEDEHDRLLSALDEAMVRLPVREYEALCITVLETNRGSIRDAGIAHDIPYSTLRYRRIEGLRRLRKYLARALRRAPCSLRLP